MYKRQLLGPIEGLDLSGIAWAFAGGESGLKARPMREEWVVSLKDQCVRAGVAFSFHQWGGRDRSLRRDPVLDGRVWDEMPAAYSALPDARGQLPLF